jgi:hypothetical protein
VSSPLPEAIRLPSGDHATHYSGTFKLITR